MLVTVAVSTVVWLGVTFATKPEPDRVLEAFYRRVRPGGPGWAVVSERAGFGRESIPGGALAWTNWIAGIVADSVPEREYQETLAKAGVMFEAIRMAEEMP